MLKELINLYYNRHKKEWYHKTESLSDVESYEANLFASINEIVTMIEYINSFLDTKIYNLLNRLPIDIVTENNNTYLYIDFTDPLIHLKKDDVELEVNYKLFNNQPPVKHQFNRYDRSKKSLDKLFIVKIDNNGVINKNSVIYNYLFTYIKIISGVEYSNDIGTISDYISLSDMHKI